MTSFPKSTRAGWLLAAASGMIVFFGQSVMATIWRLDFPYYDEWLTALTVLKPLVEGTFDPAALLAPHNEHRILTARLVSITLFWLMGAWDEHAATLVSAALNGSIVFLLVAICRHFGRSAQRYASVMLVAVLVWPSQFENFVQGIQTTMFLTLFFGILAVFLATRPGPGAWPRWLLLLGCGLAGSLSTASGLLVWVVMAGLFIERAVNGRQSKQEAVKPAIAALGCLAAALFFYQTTPVLPSSDWLRAPDFRSGLTAFFTALAYPYGIVSPLLVAWLWLPVALTAAFGWRFRNDPFPRVIAGLAALSLLVAAAFAEARSSIGPVPSSRYTTLLELFIISGLLGWLWLRARARSLMNPQWARATLLLTIVWTGTIVAGFGLRLTDDLNNANAYSQWGNLNEDRAAEYLATNDRATLVSYGAAGLIYPDPEVLVNWLNDPTLRAILPLNARRTPLATWQSTPPDAWSSRRTPPTVPSQLAWTGSWSPTNTTGTLTSPPARLGGPYLRITYAGAPNQMAPAIRIRGASQEISRTLPHAGDHWQTTLVPVRELAGQIVTIQLVDSDPAAWWAIGNLTAASDGELLVEWFFAHAGWGLLAAIFLWLATFLLED